MSNTYQDLHILARRVRRDFMAEMIKVGTEALNTIGQHNPGLQQQIMDRFQNQPCRAAHWLTCDRDTSTALTPLQNLARGEVHVIRHRLDAYVPLKDR